ITRIVEYGAGIDAANFNEIQLAMRCGASKDNIIATPNNLSPNELKMIKNSGVSTNFDYEGQLDLLEGDIPDTVSFRINPGIGRGEFAGTTTAGKNVKFGISKEDAIRAYSKALNQGAKHFGIHMMTGSNVLDPEFFNQSTKLFFKIAEIIEDQTGINFDFIDIGGGFGVPYMDNKPLDINKTGEFISNNFMDSNKRGYFNNSHLLIEPGRYIIADSAILLASVTSIKKSGHTLIGINASMNSLIRIPLYGAHHRIILSGHSYNEATEEYDIVGQACENTDYLGRNVKLPEPKIGDILIILDAGAYVSSMASNYNLLPRPGELVLDGGNKILTRAHDSLESMIFPYKNNFDIN
ncbi:diaminopimelate decarboxylase, partial [Ferroplasma sp.]|uniref:diaminopimelate decarboxylase n=1 Tax=Ferroplasma sp. TaxID=2591003 RepID=UPI00307F4E51